MKHVFRLAALALTLSATAVAGPATNKGEPEKPGQPGYSLAAWYQCTFYCADGTVRRPQCNIPPATIDQCCETANMLGCGAHGGLASGSCTLGLDTQYCP